jgi:hypothetical protein
MRAWRTLGDGVVIFAAVMVVCEFFGTLIGLEIRNWMWSDAMLTLYFIVSSIATFLLVVLFDNYSKLRVAALYGSAVVVVLNFFLFFIFNSENL